MADTFQYKVRDRTGNVTTGSLVADSEALVLSRLREQGLTPLDVKRQKRGIGQIEFGGKKVKLKQVALFSRQFATMVNSGLPILRAIGDPVGSERQQGAGPRPERGSPRRRAGFVAVRRDREARPRLQQPVRLDGEGGGDGWFSGLHPDCPGRHDRARGAAAREDQVGDDLPGRRGRPRGPHHVRDAAVRRSAVRVDLQPARRDAPAPHPRSAVDVRDVQVVLVHRPRRGDRRPVLLPPVQEDGEGP